MQKTAAFNPRPVAIRVISIFKILKAVLLIAVGVEAFLVPDDVIADWLSYYILKLHPSDYWIHRLFSLVDLINAKSLKVIGAATFIYATLFLIEGIGLWFYKRWAEVFTVIVTASFIPLELYEWWGHFSIYKAVLITINMVVLCYLIVRLREECNR